MILGARTVLPLSRALADQDSPLTNYQPMSKTKVAIIGVGYLGRQHARIYSELDSVDLVGVVDKNPETATAIATELDTKAYTDFKDLLGKVTAVSLAAPTSDHASIGCELMRQGIDVLVEKPIASSLEEAEALIELRVLIGASYRWDIWSVSIRLWWLHGASPGSRCFSKATGWECSHPEAWILMLCLT